MCLKIDWTSLIVGSKFTIFSLFYFVFEGNFPSTSRLRAYIWRGDLTEGFLRYEFGGLIFGGAYTWTGLFSEFFGILYERNTCFLHNMDDLVKRSVFRSIKTKTGQIKSLFFQVRSF